jgi:AcrR family transcriptional regulator
MSSPEPSPPTRTDRRRARTRAALLDAARVLFAERGVEMATIAQIAERADVAKGSFYNHFESRDDILNAVVATSLDTLGAALDRRFEAEEADPALALAASLRSTLRVCIEDPTLGGFLLQSSSVFEVAEGTIAERGRHDLERGRQSGRFRFDDVETALCLIAGASQAVLRRRLRGEIGEDAERHAITMILVMLGLSPREASDIAAEVEPDHERSDPLTRVLRPQPDSCRDDPLPE